MWNFFIILCFIIKISDLVSNSVKNGLKNEIECVVILQ